MAQHRVVSLLQEAVDLLGSGSAQTSRSAVPSTTLAEATDSESVRSTNQNRLRQLFAPYRRNNGNARPNRTDTVPRWTHKFCCLAECDQKTIPNRIEKQVLLQAGLGEAKLTMAKTSCHTDLRDALLKQYPKLANGGGFKLCRSGVVLRADLEAIRVPPQGYSSEYLAERCGLGQCTVFICPLQCALSTDTEVTDINDSFREACLSCEKLIPVQEMERHLERCGSDTSDELAPVKRRRGTTPICEFACVKESKSTDQNKISQETCPVCEETLPAADIVLHAATCGEDNGNQEETTLNDYLKGQEKALDDNGVWDIPVIRRLFIKTAMQQLADADEGDWCKKLKIQFIGEEGLDAGGLTREFFSMLFQQTPVFEDGLFSHHSHLLDEKAYHLLGRSTALALTVGHAGPQCLDSHIVKYILNGTIPGMDDLREQLNRQDAESAVSEILAVTTETVSDTSLKHADMLEIVGFRKMLTKDNKKEATNAIKIHYMFYQCLPGILQFMTGLKLHGVLAALQKFPDDALKCLGKTEYVQAAAVLKFFEPVFSTDRKEKDLEEVVVYNFGNFLKKLERRKIQTRWYNMAEDQEDDVTLNMSHFLQAVVGSPSLPTNVLSGLLVFDHTGKQLSTVNTCAPSIKFSNIIEIQSEEKFQKDMLNIIVGAYGFGIE